jgi:hypothetical protein
LADRQSGAMTSAAEPALLVPPPRQLGEGSGERSCPYRWLEVEDFEPNTRRGRYAPPGRK